MKLVAYAAKGSTLVGRVDVNDQVTAIGEIDAFWANPQIAATSAGEIAGALASLEQRPIVPQSARVVCVGLNYRQHAEESNLPIPTEPVIFSRWGKTLSVDGAPAPAVDDKFDWEVELGVVIGRRAFRVDEAQAAESIFGYVAFNDLSARSYQLRTPQWTLGKNSDASGPMSPLVTADAVADPADGLRLSTRVNGETMQDSSTADMIFTVPQIIAYVSQVITLEPGDLIVTGTPQGVGMARGRFLKPGDVVEVEVEGIGRVRTPIVDVAAFAGN